MKVKRTDKGGVSRRTAAKELKVSNEDPLVTFWSRRIRAATKKLEEKGGHLRNKSGEWKDLQEIFEGKQWRGDPPNARKWHRITANVLKSNIDAIRPNLYFKDPTIKLELRNPAIAQADIPDPNAPPQQGATAPFGAPPTAEGGAPGAPPPPLIKRGTPVAVIGGKVVAAEEQRDLIQGVAQYFLKECRCKRYNRRVINDALVMPYGVSKWEWVVETEDKTDQETGEKYQAVTRQYPVYSRIKPWQFVWDTELDELEMELARWVAELKFIDRRTLEADSALKIDWKEIGSSDVYHSKYFDGDNLISGEEDDKEALYAVWEIHDMEGDRLLVWVEGSKTINREESPSPYSDVEGSVFSILGFDEAIADSFPTPILSQVRSPAEAYNFMLSYQVNHTCRGNRKYKVLKGTMKDSERTKWESGADNTTIEVESMNAGPEPIEDAKISNDMYAVAPQLKREITEGLGVSAMDRASREPGVDTAYEASQIQSGGAVKLEDKRDQVRQWMIDNVRKLIQLLQSKATTAMVSKIVGKDLGEHWVKWTKDDIQGEFLVDVDIYSAAPFSQLEDRRQAMEMFSLAQQDQYFNPYKVRQKIVGTMGWDRDLLLTEAEVAERQQEAAAQAQAQQQAQAAAEGPQSQTLRPSDGQVMRRPDMVAAIRGGARKGA
jgi:hypothetical protein